MKKNVKAYFTSGAALDIKLPVTTLEYEQGGTCGRIIITTNVTTYYLRESAVDFIEAQDVDSDGYTLERFS